MNMMHMEGKDDPDGSIEIEELDTNLKVLESLGLNMDEINLYAIISSRDMVSIGEIIILGKKLLQKDLKTEKIEKYIQDLVEKGLLNKIPGKTTLYKILPPYSAILKQLENFKDTVKEIQSSIPLKLEKQFEKIEQSSSLKKFEQYKEYIHKLHDDIPEMIGKEFKRFEKELEQIDKLNETRYYIKRLKENIPIDVTREFRKMEDKIGDIKIKVAETFEKQFRIGAIKDVASKIVSKILETQFKEMNDYFRLKYIQSMKEMLEKVGDQLGTVSDTADEITGGLDIAFEYIDAGIKTTLEEAEDKIDDVQKDIQNGLTEIKEEFQKITIDALENEFISEIDDKLRNSQDTVKKFMIRSKKVTSESYDDIWYIRTPEAIQAKINEALANTKMKIFLITPTIQDIDIVALLNTKSRINIRISTFYDLNKTNDKEIYIKLTERANIRIRHYLRQNVWAINKDFEEIILCAVSKREDGTLEIAGMGSILDEHIKLFTPVIEDVWIQSKKSEIY